MKRQNPQHAQGLLLFIALALIAIGALADSWGLVGVGAVVVVALFLNKLEQSKAR